MAIDYLWHDHPLEMRSVLSDAKACCFVCLQSLSGYNYRYPDCNFFIHISCLKLPLESLHPLHQHHPLTLLSNPPHNYDDESPQVQCNECKSPCSGFTYHCAACSFSLHLQCASKQHAFKLEIHKHPLTFFVSPPGGFESFRCYVCADLGYGFNLACKACNFEIHVECSAIPVTVKSTRHRHPFSLTSVRSIDDGSDEFYCDIVCEGEVNPRACVYYCAECNYMAHLGCLTSAPKPQIKLAYKDVDISSTGTVNESNPETDQSGFSVPFGLQIGQTEDDGLVKLRHRFSELRIMDKGLLRSQAGGELEHFSHQHPLVLSGEHGKDRVTCGGCWERIQGPAYSCTECNYFLHQWCAELPRKIQHPIHPEHVLTLLARAPIGYGHACGACDESCDLFTFNCDRCSFNLHAMCASVPNPLRNEIHEHPLILRKSRHNHIWCKVCGDHISYTIFECEMCNLELDFKCGLLPHKIRHRCHVHPLILTFVPVPVEDDSDELYCHACEKKRDPNHWVYSCADCVYTAHLGCVVSGLIGGCPIEGLLRYNHHEHLLGLITKSPFNPS